jgi:hypothetical protein
MADEEKRNREDTANFEYRNDKSVKIPRDELEDIRRARDAEGAGGPVTPSACARFMARSCRIILSLLFGSLRLMT